MGVFYQLISTAYYIEISTEALSTRSQVGCDGRQWNDMQNLVQGVNCFLNYRHVYNNYRRAK